MKSNMMDPEILLILSTSKSLTEMKELALQAIKDKKLENDQVRQLGEQLQQAQQQMQQMQKQLEASTKKIAQLNEKKMQIEQQDNQMRQSIDWFVARTDDENKKKELELIERRNKLEAIQLIDNNPNNDEILNDKR